MSNTVSLDIEDQPVMTARRLILSLMNAAGTDEMSVARLISAGRVFDIEDAAIRMAATRLTKDGLLASPDRGLYSSGPRARALRDQVRGWRTIRDRMKPWQGGWIAAPTGNLGRTDRKQLRERSQALRLYGFAEAEPDFWVRPDNLAVGLAALRSELVAIGLDEAAMLLAIGDYSGHGDIDFTGLWDGEALQRTYGAALEAMRRSTAWIPSIGAAEGARETLLLGQAVIRLINLDPLLPDQMTDGAMMAAMIDAMKDYDALGKQCWRAHYAEAADADSSPD